jgi:hypothetical protein
VIPLGTGWRRTDFSKLHRSHPHIELLEARCVPSTVTSLNDDGAGSLRQAIIDTPAGGTVDFQPGLTGTIMLTTGELAIGKDLTIAGPGADVITVSGNHASRVFDIAPSDNVAISGISVTGARGTSGGGILNQGALNLADVTLSGNVGLAGGGMYNEGTVTIRDAAISSNNGAGIYNTGHLMIDDTALDDNMSGDGAAIDNAGGTLILSGSTLSDNAAAQDGGGIYNTGTANIQDATFSGNTARSGSTSFGGGIANFGTLTVAHSTFRDNSVIVGLGSAVGGGISSVGGTATITDSTFEGNSAFGGSGLGGGVYNGGVLTLTGVTLCGNSASGSGGGLENGGTSTVSNDTFSGNTANAGGGIYNDAHILTISSSTLSGNSGRIGGGIDNGGLMAFAQFRNTLVALNTALLGPDVFRTVFSEGHNLIGDGTGGSGFAPTDLVGTSENPINPLLGPLQDNGGPTQTMALLVGSPAIGAGDPTDAPPTDQRGAPRIVNGTIDIGAYEVQPAPAPSCSVVQSLLWPPNHQLMNVGLSVQLNGDADPSTHLSVHVYANDHANTSDAADIAPDILQLRSERQGSQGRVYLIVVTATDASGQTGFDVCTVVVPHDRSGGSIARVQAEAAAAEGYYREFQTAPGGYTLLGAGPTDAARSHSLAASMGEGFGVTSPVAFASPPTAPSPISPGDLTSNTLVSGAVGPVEQYFAVTSEEQGDGDADSLVPELWLLA